MQEKKTQLEQLMEAVNESGLTKSALEEYHMKLTNLFGLASLELAEKEKMEAVFMANHQEKTDISAQRKWKACEDGLREIVLKRTVKVLEKLLSSVKNRIYSKYD